MRRSARNLEARTAISSSSQYRVIRRSHRTVGELEAEATGGLEQRAVSWPLILPVLLELVNRRMQTYSCQR